MNRQKALAIALGVLVLIVAWVYLVPGDSSAPPPAARPAAGGDGEVGIGGGDEPRPRAVGRAVNSRASGKDVRTIIPLHIADLNFTPRNFSGGRDPWRFVEPPPPPPPQPARPTAAQLRAMEEAEAARQRMLREMAEKAAIEAAKPKPPPFTWSYLGNFGPASHRIAVFADGDKVYNAREGEVIGGKFIVAQIGYESVDIRFVGFPDWPAQRLAAKK